MQAGRVNWLSVEDYDCATPHRDFEMELMHKEETDARNCSAGCYLCDAYMQLCWSYIFDGSLMGREEAEWFKPSNTKPTMMCIRWEQGCYHAVCFPCWMDKQAQKDNGGAGSRQKKVSQVGIVIMIDIIKKLPVLFHLLQN